MTTDSAFFTGKTHPVCQDFTRTHNGANKPYAILCDGCSGSPDTDTGARLLALATERTFDINDEFPYGDFKSVVITTATNMAASCGLKHNSLDATLLVAAPVMLDAKKKEGSGIEQRPGLYVGIYGDGVVVVKAKDGTIRVHSIEYTQGYPYYLTYHFDKKRGAEWRKTAIASDEKKNIVGTTYLLKPDWTLDKEYKSDYDPNVSYPLDWETKEHTPEEKARLAKVMPREIPFHIYPEGSSVTCLNEDTEWVAMLSDGVHTFREKATEPGEPNRQISLVEVLKDLLDFRVFKGEFVRRQTNWFMREAAKRNWQHDDDVSVAAIYLG